MNASIDAWSSSCSFRTALCRAAATEEGRFVGTVIVVSKLATMAGTKALAIAVGTPPDVSACFTELLSCEGLRTVEAGVTVTWTPGAVCTAVGMPRFDRS